MSTRSMKVSSLAIVFSGALFLGASTARASDARPSGTANEHTGAMSQGLNHEEAREATFKSVDVGSIEARVAKRHAEAMAQGLNHEEARAATMARSDAAKVQARAKRHLALLNGGATHEQAYSGSN